MQICKLELQLKLDTLVFSPCYFVCQSNCEYRNYGHYIFFSKARLLCLDKCIHSLPYQRPGCIDNNTIDTLEPASLILLDIYYQHEIELLVWLGFHVLLLNISANNGNTHSAKPLPYQLKF